MATLVKILSNNKQVIFDAGKFDNWCVYVVDEFGNKTAPFDTEYFSFFKNISSKYPANKVYADFVQIYSLTNKSIELEVLKLIDSITKTYLEEEKEAVEKWFTVIYAGMIAEENKAVAILKKRVKRLGMHQVLIEKMEPKVAANFSKGKKWRELDTIMKQLNF